MSGRTVLSPDAERIVIAFRRISAEGGLAGCGSRVYGSLPLHLKQAQRVEDVLGSDAERLIAKRPRRTVQDSCGSLLHVDPMLADAFLQRSDYCRRTTETATSQRRQQQRIQLI